MADIKKPAIDYTSRQFASIKADLVNYAKKYYPNEFKDFSANSFGSLMLDTVAYVGDIMSFYLDYQVNESFLSTAIEYENVLKLAQNYGYKPALSPSSYGMLTFFILIPASNGAPDFDYAPLVKRGSKFSTSQGNIFSLVEDVNFKDTAKNEVVVGNVDPDTGTPVSYAIRAKAQAVSGELSIQNFSVGAYERFLQIALRGENITEVVSVHDSEGNTYYEVDYLTQNTVYVPLTNRAADSTTVANILKPMSVPRRFRVTHQKNQVILQFGAGTNENVEEVLDPSNVLIKQHGKKYITDDSFDPSKLIQTDRLGVTPKNTVLTVVYRVNSKDDTNAAVNTIINVTDAVFDFASETTLDTSLVNGVRAGLEVINEEAFVGDIPFPNSDEIKQRAYGAYAMQNRAVTKEDFMTVAYSMPASFGAIKKVNVVQDSDTFKQRNINLYVLSEDSVGNLTPANTTIKNNLKTYMSRYKMINDSIDILDANIINLGVSFKIVAFQNTNKFSAMEDAKRSLQNFFAARKSYEIGEAFSITDIFTVLKNTPSVLDVMEVDVFLKSGATYADSNFSVEEHKSPDARKVYCPEDGCFEVKFPSTDIVGAVV